MNNLKNYTKPKNWNKSTSLKNVVVVISRYTNAKSNDKLLVFDLVINEGRRNEFHHIGPVIVDPEDLLPHVINQYMILKRITDRVLFDAEGIPLDIPVRFKCLPNATKWTVDTSTFWDHTQKPKDRSKPKAAAPKVPKKLTVPFIRAFQPKTWDIETSLKSVVFKEYQWEQPISYKIFHGGECTINQGMPDMFRIIFKTRLHTNKDIRDLISEFLITEGVTNKAVYCNGLEHPEIKLTYSQYALKQAELWKLCGPRPLKEWIL